MAGFQSVVEDDGVSPSEVDAKTSRSSRRYENEQSEIFVEPLHNLLPLFNLGCAVQTDVGVVVK